MTLSSYLATKMRAVFSYTVSNYFTFLFALLLKKKQHVSKFIRSCFSYQKHIHLGLARQCKSSTQPNTQFLLLFQPFDFIFYTLLHVPSIMMTIDFLFLPKAALLSTYLLFKPCFIKTSNPTLCRLTEFV